MTDNTERPDHTVFECGGIKFAHNVLVLPDGSTVALTHELFAFMLQPHELDAPTTEEVTQTLADLEALLEGPTA